MKGGRGDERERVRYEEVKVQEECGEEEGERERNH